MTKPLTVDVCVVGGGTGAVSLAAGAAAFGLAVVMVEAGRIGGLANDRALSQALVAAARQAAAMRSAEAFGLAQSATEIDFRVVLRHARQVAAALAPNASAERLAALGVRVIRTAASFKDRRTLVAGETEIRASHFVLAPPSLPVVTDIPGLGGIDWLTAASMVELPRRPGHLLVLGDGKAEAIELAQAFRRLGCDVTLASATAALDGHDPEMGAVVLRQLRAEGVKVLEHASATGVERRGKTAIIRLVLDTPEGPLRIEGTHLLVAAGHACALQGLGLEKAGIDHDMSGVKVNAMLRTTNRRVYAIGEATACPSHSAQAAEHQAGLLLQWLLFHRSPAKGGAVIPSLVLTDPELAHVGLTEAEAAQAHAKVRILRWPYAENERAQAERITQGHVKLVVGGKGEILGVTIAGACAGELIGIWALAMSKGLTLADMASHVLPHPTLGEIGKRAAMTYFAGAVRRPLLRRVSRMLRIFG